MHYITGKVRASFVNLSEPNQMSGKYQLDLLMPKGSAEAKSLARAIEDTIADALKSYKKWNGKGPARDKGRPIKDGDEKIEQAEKPENYAAYKGMLYITPKAEKSKGIFLFNRDRDPIEADYIYSGCYVRASLDIYPYSHDLGGKGVTIRLIGLQFLADGESLGGTHYSEERVAADFDDDFSDDDDEEDFG